jgi:transposase
MAKGYRPVRRDQPFLLPPDMREWLAADHPVWLVIEVIGEHLDTSAFHALRKTGGAGTAGYDPDMLLTVLVWGYAHKVTSSRRMEQLCATDVAFRVICGGNLPDHSSIARFRQQFPGPVAELFAEVLRLCARLGMGKLGTVALDGTKIASPASKSANRTEDALARLAEETVAAHAAGDAAEDASYGGSRGDEMPRDWSPRDRASRIRAALADLEAGREAAERDERAKAEVFRQRRDAGKRTGPHPAASAVALAEENLARARAARAAQLADLEKRYAAGQPRRGRPAGAEDYCRVREAAARLARARAAGAARQAAQQAADPVLTRPKRNITDPDSRLMPVRGGGFIQGYNAQNVTSDDGLIIAEQVTQDTTDTAWYQPMIAAARDAAALIAASRPPGPGGPGGGIGLVLADAGYCSEANLTAPGPDRLIATGKLRDLVKAARDGTVGTEPASAAIRQMATRLATPDGIAGYRQRGHIAETPHGHIKHNMGIRQLSMRGKAKAQAEWTFTCTVANLFKAITSGHLTASDLRSLAT